MGESDMFILIFAGLAHRRRRRGGSGLGICGIVHVEDKSDCRRTM